VLEHLTLRRSAIAYLYRENLSLTRAEHLKFYDRVTTSGVDVSDLSIQGPELVLVRRPLAPGSGALEIRAGLFSTPQLTQLRLLVSETVATDRPVDLVWETADLVRDAFCAIWGGKLSEPNLTEVTLEFNAAAPRGDSRGFLTESVARIDPSALHHLGRPFEGFGLRFVSNPSLTLGPGPAPELPGAQVELRLETLLADLSQLFLLATIRWPALSVPVQQLPAEVQRQIEVPVVQANIKAEKPSHYLRLSYDFVTKSVVAFLRHAAG
jgi:hypothetical protein